MTIMVTRRELKRFLSKTLVDEHDCWVWRASRKASGYGRFWWRGRLVRAHIFAYQLYKGAIPESLELDHLCRNKACVNPVHLEAVSHKVNVLRGVGITAQRAKQTHCLKGHVLLGINVRIKPTRYGVQRVCRMCQKGYYYALHQQQLTHTSRVM